MWRATAVLLALTAGGVACGDDKKEESKTGTQYDLRASAAQVGEGLNKIEALVKQIGLAASADAKAAKEQAEGIEALWQPIEGTIRENDKDSYIRFEDDFAALEKAAGDGDGTKAQATSNDVSEAVKAYLAKYPG
jgi:hypothetical protein